MNSISRKEQATVYYHANRERIKAQQIAYYQANKEKIKEQRAAHYQANKERITESKREYRKTHREECSTRDKVYRTKNSVKVLATRRRSWRKVNYGLGDDTYNMLLQKQGGICTICNRQYILKNGETATLHVDHSHGHKAVRGLLCGRCNIGLGCFADSISNLQGAVQYLLDHQQ